MKVLYVLLFTPLLFPLTGHASFRVGNGGDSVYCTAGPEGSEKSKFIADGFYVLDFAVSFPQQHSHIANFGTLDEFLDRIDGLLSRKSPNLMSSFRDFRASLFQLYDKPDASKNRVWTPSQGALTNIRDERVHTLPLNCRFKEPGRALIHQTVVRTIMPNGKVVYAYDFDMMNEFLVHSVRQASVILIHEWLWDHFQDAVAVRAANAFLHSLEADQATPKEFHEKLFGK